NEEELAAIQRLDDQARRLERTATGPSLAVLIAEERTRSHDYGGRSVSGWEPSPETSGKGAEGEVASDFEAVRQGKV
ncbi:MAG TPA: hypothetical protein VGG47_03575, partial [Acidocella sp.]